MSTREEGQSLHSELIPAQESGSRKLLVMLHGLGDSMDGYRWMPAVMRLPWLNYLLVNAPDEYYGGYSWFDFGGDSAPGIKRSRALLTDLLDGLPGAGFLPEQTILGGFSQGGLMSVEVGLRYPHRLAGIICLSGYIPEPERLVEQLSPVALQQRVLVTHGTVDPMIPFAVVREQVNVLKAAGLHLEWHELVKEHTIAVETEIGIIRDFIRAAFAQEPGTIRG